MQYAQVVVDVPTQQTNRAFDYLIPENYIGIIQLGMRVVVPFGRGARKVQGFVVGFKDEIDYQGKVKPIDAIIDPEPALNQELIDLSIWMADETYAFWITCLQVMLPSVMRAKYQKVIRPTEMITTTDRQVLFGDRPQLLFDDITEPDQVKRILQLKDQGQIEIEYQVGNQAKSKITTFVHSLIDENRLKNIQSSIRKNAKQQLQLTDYLAHLKQDIALSEATQTTGISSATFKTGVQKGWLKEYPVETYRKPYAAKKADQALALNDEQQTATDAITKAASENKAQTFLLEGVTGSGKTEVYLQSIASVLKEGKTALMLVPEISLTPQMVNRVQARFGDQVAVLHSGLSKGEKYDEWRRIKRGEAKVVVGARSAAFAPLENIGLLIMDEEHEASYKQEDMPRYHARDILIWRSQRNHAPLVLGSATPSLESRSRAQKGVYQLLMMKKRINDHPLPTVELVDLKTSMNNKHVSQNFSGKLLDEIKLNLHRHEQSILLLNRRGYSNFLMCRNCGFVLKCPNCDISLTMHLNSHSMKCHYCGHEEPIPNACPNCHSDKMRSYGTGTEKVEQELNQYFPNARILRMDVDRTKRKGDHERILKKFGDHEADILLGTQMIAKGLDFPDVTLVGVINADTALDLPDFRAGEQTFQLLTQVSGRAGRADKSGRVIVQSYNPNHYAIQFAKTQDYEGFYNYEMAVRHRGNYTPFYYTLTLTVSHKNEGMAARKSFELLKYIKPNLTDQAIVLGPTPKMIARINNRYFYQIVIKYKQEPQLHATLLKLLEATQTDIRQGFQIAIDRDPQRF